MARDSREMEIIGNFALNVRATTRASFTHAIAIACAHAAGGAVSHWCQDKVYGLVFFWSGSDGQFRGNPVVPLPFEMNATEAAEFAWQWYTKADREQYALTGGDSYYEGDGSSMPAFRVFVEDWGHVGGSHYAVCALLPCWAWLGK